MRRALVISILAHLVVMGALFEFRVFSLQSQVPVNPGGRLSVDLVAIERAPVASRGDRRPPSLIAMSALEQRTDSQSALQAGRARHIVGNALAKTYRSEQSFSSPPTKPEGLSNLPANIEAEYRLHLVREMRKTKSAAEGVDAYPLTGSVSLLISYWHGLPGPVISVSRSSGLQALDAVALNDLKAALARAPLPGLVSGASFQMPFTLEYQASR